MPILEAYISVSLSLSRIGALQRVWFILAFPIFPTSVSWLHVFCHLIPTLTSPWSRWSRAVPSTMFMLIALPHKSSSVFTITPTLTHTRSSYRDLLWIVLFNPFGDNQTYTHLLALLGICSLSSHTWLLSSSTYTSQLIFFIHPVLPIRW